MEWQIRERGTDEVLTTFESDSYTITVFGSVRAYYEHEHDHAIDVDFDFDKHYVSRKGEILVSEQEYNALKAELKAQKEESKPLGVDDPSFEGACVRAEQKILNRAKSASEPEKEVTRGDDIVELICGLIEIANEDESSYSLPQQEAKQKQEFFIRQTLADLINQGV